jgi:hypothetical protein
MRLGDLIQRWRTGMSILAGLPALLSPQRFRGDMIMRAMRQAESIEIPDGQAKPGQPPQQAQQFPGQQFFQPQQKPGSGQTQDTHWQIGPWQIPKPSFFQKGTNQTQPSNNGQSGNTTTAVAEQAATGSQNNLGSSQREVIPNATPLYPEYKCLHSNPLSCENPQKTLQESPKAKFCSKCGFPVPLAPRQEIRGRRGTYRISHALGKRGLGRLYAAVGSDNQPVVIKEYLLPSRSFPSLEDIQQRQATFTSIAALGAADGRSQDFRLIPTWEAIPDQQDRRCYLVTRGTIAAAPTLSTYLSDKGPMHSESVRRLLDQVLQTLEFLHGQRFQFGMGQIRQGLVHGGLSLDSLLIAPPNQDFFTYVCDLALWEYLFDPMTTTTRNDPPSVDLVALGHVGFYLLVGRSTDRSTGQFFDPRDPQQWPQDVDPPTKDFILRLIGFHPPFEGATVARQTLWQLPPVGFQVNEEVLSQTTEEDEKGKARFLGIPIWVWISALVALLGSVGFLVWSLFGPKPQKAAEVSGPPLITIDKIAGVPAGEFGYTTEKPGSAYYSLLELKSTNPLDQGKNLTEQLLTFFPELELIHESVDSTKTALEKVSDESAAFAAVSISEYPKNKGLEQFNVSYLNEFNRYDIAYDGLFVYVPFLFDRSALPRSLKGQISFAQLRNLYTGKIRNWKEIGGPDREVQLYVPTEAESIRLFEERVLGDQVAIEDFQALVKDGTINQEETRETMKHLRSDFENRSVGGISFGLAAKVFGDCNVYPLALQGQENTSAVQSIKLEIDNRIFEMKPNTDLCNLKGSYVLDEDQFRTGKYPLAYPLSVISLRTNQSDDQYRIGRKFAEMLRTKEGQCLLRRANLSPLTNVSCAQ